MTVWKLIKINENVWRINGDCQFHKTKQAIELQSPTDNSNQVMDLANTLLEMKSLIAQFKQQQSSRPS